MGDSLKIKFSNAFTWIKVIVLWLWFHRCLFLWVQSIIHQHCSDNGLTPNMQQAITWTNVDHVLWCHLASQGHHEWRNSEITHNQIICIQRSGQEVDKAPQIFGCNAAIFPVYMAVWCNILQLGLNTALLTHWGLAGTHKGLVMP